MAGIGWSDPAISSSKTTVYVIADPLTVMELRPLSTRIRAYLFHSVFSNLKRFLLAVLLALFPRLRSHKIARDAAIRKHLPAK